MTFQDYLQQKQLSPSTITTYLKHLSTFQHWLQTQSLSPQNTTYTDLLAYIQALRDQSLHPKTINAHLTLIRHYYQYLIHQNQAKHNPAQGLHLKGISRSVPHNLLSETQLQAIEGSYQSQVQVQVQNLARQRNQVILSLIIHQALRRAELEALQPQHLSSTHIHVPATKESNERILPLKNDQPQLLHDYLSITRPQILAQRADKIPETALIPTMNTGKSLKNVIYSLIKHLRKTHPYLQHARQLRHSRIRLWLNTHDLRVVQYLAGHAYISSTERYAFGNIKDLQKQLSRFHPLG